MSLCAARSECSTGRVSLPRALSLLWLAALASVFSPEAAQAHGKHVNLDEYCNVLKSAGGFLAPKWYAEYSKQRGAWTCVSTQYGYGNVNVYEAPLDPRKACEWKWGLSQAHFHAGDDVTSQSSVHCGQADGLIARDALTTTMLQLCNRSATPRVSAAYAFWDTRDRNRPGWTSEGWYGINRGECVDLQIAVGFTGYVYVYGTGGETTWEGPDHKFCIDAENAFKVTDSDKASCGSAPYKRVGMFKVDVTPGVNSWNFR